MCATSVNIVVTAPMPIASDATARAVKPRASHLTKRKPHVPDNRSNAITLADRGVAPPSCGMEPATRALEIPEAAQCLSARELGRHAGPHEVGDPHRDVTFDLEIHLDVGAPASAEPEIEEPAVGGAPRHAVRLASVRIAVTDCV